MSDQEILEAVQQVYQKPSPPTNTVNTNQQSVNNMQQPMNNQQQNLEHTTVISNGQDINQSKTCQRCGMINQPNAIVCSKCGNII